MAINDSALNPQSLARVRMLLTPRPPAERMWPALAAAFFAAASALGFAAAMILAPPVVSHHVAQSGG